MDVYAKYLKFLLHKNEKDDTVSGLSKYNQYHNKKCIHFCIQFCANSDSIRIYIKIINVDIFVNSIQQYFDNQVILPELVQATMQRIISELVIYEDDFLWEKRNKIMNGLLQQVKEYVEDELMYVG